MSTKKTAIRFAQAFNATCRAGAIGGQPFSHEQKQILFDQLALVISDLGDKFDQGKFEDACQPGFNPSQCG